MGGSSQPQPSTWPGGDGPGKTPGGLFFFFRNHFAFSVGLSQEKATVTLKNASIHSTQLAQLLSIVTVLEAETTHRRCSAPLALPSSLTCSERWGSGRTWTRRGKPFLWAEVPWPHGMWTGCRAGPGGNVERVLKGGAGRTKDLREDTALGRGGASTLAAARDRAGTWWARMS